MDDCSVIMVLIDDFWSLAVSEESRSESGVDAVRDNDSFLVI